MGSLRNNSIVVAILLLGVVSQVSAQVMQSTNYRIQSDSINVGGTQSSSTSYYLEDTTGEVATGQSSSTSYLLNAGYQEMQETYLSLSDTTAVDLTPSIGGVSGGISNGSTTVTVLTDSYSGYQLTIRASTSPAMNSGSDTIADYAPVGADPDFSFTTGAAQSHLGFSPEGIDVVARFKDNGASCNVGALETSLSCWDGLSVSDKAVASRTSANHPGGSTTTVRFRVGIGGSVSQAPGIYTATSTLTLLPL